MSYKSRLSAPDSVNKYYLHKSKGGLNECILISGKSCLPNCVGYAWGRFYEISGKRPKLSVGNAENWYGYADGYKRGSTPKLGAVICWSKGKVGVSSDGAGHVAIVEQINADGSIVISESGYGGSRWFKETLKKPYAKSGYKLQGFIYNPAVTDTTEIKYKSGTNYKLVDNVNIRVNAGTKYAIKQIKAVSKDAQKNCTTTKSTALATLKKGTVVTCLEVKTVGNDIWLKIPSGWVCAKKGSEVYIK